MSAYIVVEVDVKDPDRYADYRAMVPASLEVYGGKFLVRGGAVEKLEGGWEPSRFVIIEFDSVAQAKRWWVRLKSSRAGQTILPLQFQPTAAAPHSAERLTG